MTELRGERLIDSLLEHLLDIHARLLRAADAHADGDGSFACSLIDDLVGDVSALLELIVDGS